METQDFKIELMDYIYGEMSSERRKEFEQKLSEDEDLRKEFEALKSVRQELNILKDKEVMEPFSTWRKPRSPYWFRVRSNRKMVVFRPVTAVAASLVILLILGYIMNFSISLNDQGLSLGFSNQVQTNEERLLVEEDVKKLVQDALLDNNKMLLTKLTKAENFYNDKFIAMETTLSNAIITQEKSVVTNEDLQRFFADAENKNTKMMRDYLRFSTDKQQEYFKTMLTQFNEFMQDQRSKDLTIIRNSLIELKQNQHMQKQETDNVLASLISTVNQNKN